LLSSPSGFLAFDDQCVIRDTNEEATRLLGYARGELTGRSLLEILARPARIFFSAQVLPALGQNQRVEEAYLSFRTMSGELLPVLLNVERRGAEQAALNRCAFLPMRRRQLFERELLEAQAAAEEARAREQAAIERIRAMQAKLALQDRLATLGTLAAGIVHEINNPLSYVSVNLQLLDQALGAGDLERDREEARVLTREAMEGMTRIGGLLKAIRMFSRFEAEDLVAVDLAEVVGTSVRMSEHQVREKARVELDLRPHALVLGDAARLAQVVINLLLNASQAFPAATPTQNRIVVSLRDGAKARVVLEVRDNGPGIPRELHARIFEAFFTTKPAGQGTGLGLSICKEIIDSLGGELSLRSEAGAGASFLIELPAVPAPASTRP
jgi:PAS domain S-box-containing protein